MSRLVHRFFRIRQLYSDDNGRPVRYLEVLAFAV